MEKLRNFCKQHKKPLIIIGIILALAGLATAVYFLCFYHPDQPAEETQANTPSQPVKHYSKLSGEEIASAAENDKPLYCMQIPNGLDIGQPRVHVGLHQAKVVFEAIAEAGITRFAAVFQNPQGSMLGPIRSVRGYYLDWDTPFDCTVVHAGGADDALARLQSDGYRDLTENYDYMWRDYNAYIAPNNLFTSPADLSQFNADRGYATSDFTAWPRLTPDEAAAAVAKLTTPADSSTSTDADTNADSGAGSDSNTDSDTEATPTEPAPTPVKTITVRFGYTPAFNPTYTYDIASNTYLRGYESGEAHQAYECPADLKGPNPATCAASQLAPSVVAVIRVKQWTDSDGYHQVLDTISNGTATIFQNGTVIEGTWRKSAVNSQIEFLDSAGQPIKLAPGQLWISAIPTSVGSLDYQ